MFCTPEYAGALPGSFTNLLDWTVGDQSQHLTPDPVTDATGGEALALRCA